MSNCEIAVIGGGPAGSLTGAILAKNGFDTTIFDRATFPRKKLCGEFIAPGGTRALSNFGLLKSLTAAGGTPISRFIITTPNGTRLSQELHEPGFALSRKRLDVLLLCHARECGATVETSSRVAKISSDYRSQRPNHELQIKTKQKKSEQSVTCELVVGAYGRRTKLDRTLNRPFFETRSPYVGFQRHHHPRSGTPSLANQVELYLIPGGYCGLVRVERDLVNVCMMIHRSVLNENHHNWTALNESLLSRNDALKQRLNTLQPAEDTFRSVAQIPLQKKESYRAPVLFTGDATGMIAPLTGNGQASAIRSGIALARQISSFGIPETSHEFQELGERWSRSWNRNFSGQITTGRLLHALFQYRTASSAVLKFLRYIPSLTSILQKVVTSGQTK